MIAVAIDGPAGAGKSSVAKKIAFDLNYIYVDTGALYRAIGLYMTEEKIDISDETKVSAALDSGKIYVEIKHYGDGQHVLLCGKDVNDKIRTGEISMAASKVSAIPKVRSFLFDLQRDIAEKNNIVMDGRDIGTVVLPNAQVKIFLTASPEERARRRTLELEEKGTSCDYSQILEEIKKRDFQDMNREIAPLKPAIDSITVDTSNMGFEEVVESLKNIIKNKIGI